MSHTVHHLTRRGHAKTQEAERQAKAADAANRAVLAALVGHSGDERLRRADALLDAAIIAHATIAGPDVTAPRLSKHSGLIYPATSQREDKFAKADAQIWKVG